MSLILAVCIVAGYAQLHIFRVVAHDDQDDGDSKDAADLGDLEMKDYESRAGYKQRMLNKRLEEARAEVTLLERSVASYRSYQEHELDEVRPSSWFGLPTKYRQQASTWPMIPMPRHSWTRCT